MSTLKLPKLNLPKLVMISREEYEVRTNWVDPRFVVSKVKP